MYLDGSHEGIQPRDLNPAFSFTLRRLRVPEKQKAKHDKQQMLSVKIYIETSVLLSVFSI